MKILKAINNLIEESLVNSLINTGTRVAYKGTTPGYNNMSIGQIITDPKFLALGAGGILLSNALSKKTNPNIPNQQLNA